MTKIKSFKIKNESVKNSLYLYKLMKVRLSNKDLLVNSTVDEKTANEYKRYIQAVDTVLSAMDKESSSILQNVHLKSVDKNELGFSTSTFYNKYRKATSEFLEMFS